MASIGKGIDGNVSVCQFRGAGCQPAFDVVTFAAGWATCPTKLRHYRIDRLPEWLGLVALVVIGALATRQASAQTHAGSSAIVDASPGTTLQCQGVTSCTAAACHNANGPAGSKRSEYTTWFAHDKHARAYAVLAEPRSQIIVRNYRQPLSGKTLRAEEDRTCLKCHALAPELAGTQQAYLNSDGVSCENCHGRAEKWLAIHYLPEWKDRTDRDKLRDGMTPTKNLAYRAKLCAECHIGSPDNDLNHDLYAAGHPPLYYEYSAFLGSMPKHWSEREEKARQPDYEIRVWALGQVVSARAALDLLASRAGTKSKPWPEFAEYSCIACHHDLQANGRRQETVPGERRKPGSLPWGSWFASMLPGALDGQVSPQTAKKIAVELDTLRNRMETPIPRRDEVAALAKRLVSELDPSLARMEDSAFDRTFLDNLSRALSADERKTGMANWEEATQAYLALAAVYHAKVDLGLDGSRHSLKFDLEARRRRLQFPDELPIPRRFDLRPPGGRRPEAPH